MGEQAPRANPNRKIQRSSTMPVSLVERAQNAVFWTRNIPGEPVSYSDLNRRGVLDQVERLERLYNDGAAFAQGDGLHPGPAPGVMKEVARMRRVAKDAEEAKAAGDVEDRQPRGSGSGGEPHE